MDSSEEGDSSDVDSSEEGDFIDADSAEEETKEIQSRKIGPGLKI